MKGGCIGGTAGTRIRRVFQYCRSRPSNSCSDGTQEEPYESQCREPKSCHCQTSGAYCLRSHSEGTLVHLFNGQNPIRRNVRAPRESRAIGLFAWSASFVKSGVGELLHLECTCVSLRGRSIEEGEEEVRRRLVPGEKCPDIVVVPDIGRILER
jgi:hypothetical protein